MSSERIAMTITFLAALVLAGAMGEATPSPKPPSLAGTTWQVSAIDNGHQEVGSPLAGTSLTIAFDRKSVHGNGGCNTFRGPYSKTGTTLTFGAMASTRKACTAEGVMEQEQRFLSGLASVVKFELDGDTLVLQRGDGSRVVEARKPAK